MNQTGKGIEYRDKTRKGCGVKLVKCIYFEAGGEQEPVRLGVGGRQEKWGLLKLWVEEFQEQSTTHEWRQEGRRQGSWWLEKVDLPATSVESRKLRAEKFETDKVGCWNGQEEMEATLAPRKTKSNRKGKYIAIGGISSGVFFFALAVVVGFKAV